MSFQYLKKCFVCLYKMYQFKTHFTSEIQINVVHFSNAKKRQGVKDCWQGIRNLLHQRKIIKKKSFLNLMHNVSTLFMNYQVFTILNSMAYNNNRLNIAQNCDFDRTCQMKFVIKFRIRTSLTKPNIYSRSAISIQYNHILSNIILWHKQK